MPNEIHCPHCRELMGYWTDRPEAKTAGILCPSDPAHANVYRDLEKETGKPESAHGFGWDFPVGAPEMHVLERPAFIPMTPEEMAADFDRRAGNLDRAADEVSTRGAYKYAASCRIEARQFRAAAQKIRDEIISA
jgi:hypothetical protein